MEIKSKTTSSIQPKVTSENVENKDASVKTGIANTKDSFVSDSAASSSDSVFSFIMEYQKMMNKEARQDRELARSSEHIRLSSKQSKLSSDDNEIKSAKGSRDMYQVVDSEASLEFFIGNAGRLLKGDTQNDIDLMKSQLDELKKSQTQIQEKLIRNTRTDSDDDD
jgi:hypothetical protein